MLTQRVTLSPSAEEDLDSICRHILGTSGRVRAESVLSNLIGARRQLRHVPLRGKRRDDRRPGVRRIGYRRRASNAFVIAADEVIVLHVARRGRDPTMNF